MAAVVNYIHDFIEEHEDKRVSDWFLMASPKSTIAIIATYVALVYLILPAYMTNRKPYDLTSVIRAYNIFQILSCSMIIYWMATSGWIQGNYTLGCQPIDYSNNSKAISMLRGFQWTYLLKITELAETIFFVLRKKYNQVSNLHVYHHVSMVALTWLSCKFIGGGMASVPVMVNSFIHILMYMYYYLASLGPEWQKRLLPWKPRLTIAQMVQFTFLLMHGIGVLKPSCDAPRSFFLMLYLPNIAIFYKMFYDFYQESYNKKPKKL